MDYQELLERLRRGNYYHAQIEEAADVIESLLAENERLNAELAKYCDAPVVAWNGGKHGCEWTTDKAIAEKWLSTPSQQAVPLIIKPEENK